MHPQDHKEITAKALEQAAVLFPAWDLLQDPRLQDSLIKGSFLEDSRPLWERITNWHFFRSNSGIPAGRVPLALVFAAYPTSERILVKRAEQFLAGVREEAPASKSWQALGRIAHHIQDMSTPSHVVPVYHGVCKKDGFEEFSSNAIKDALGKLPAPAGAWDYRPKPDGREPLSLYENAAQRTLAWLGHPGNRFSFKLNGTPKQGGWDLFWRPCRPGEKPDHRRPGFGVFGPLADHFGDTRFTLGRDEYFLDQKVYQALYMGVLERAVRDTIKVIAWGRLAFYPPDA